MSEASDETKGKKMSDLKSPYKSLLCDFAVHNGGRDSTAMRNAAQALYVLTLQRREDEWGHPAVVVAFAGIAGVMSMTGGGDPTMVAEILGLTCAGADNWLQGHIDQPNDWSGEKLQVLFEMEFSEDAILQ